MCPICMATTALIVAGSGSTCGLAALVTTKLRKKAKGTGSMPASTGYDPKEGEVRK